MDSYCAELQNALRGMQCARYAEERYCRLLRIAEGKKMQPFSRLLMLNQMLTNCLLGRFRITV
jgi:hypothetical protein